MKKFLNFGLSLYVLVAIVSIILLNYLFTNYSKNLLILSPLPDFLTYFKNNQVATINLWFPSFSLFGVNVGEPKISAKSALIYDLSSEKTIYSKNPKEKLSMASLTKIMTAIVALENKQIHAPDGTWQSLRSDELKKNDDRYLVRKENLVGENSMGLSENEVLNLRELLYGLILTSGNDSAETLASNFSGGRSAFIKAMNDKAKALGLSDTNFTNPTGLEGNGFQYTTAYDLLVITKYALSKFPTFNDVVSTFDYNIFATTTHKAFYLENETNLLTSYPGVKGVKTGYTLEAGLCLVTFLDYKGHKILGVLLNSDNRRGDMKDLLDYALKIQGVKPPPHI